VSTPPVPRGNLPPLPRGAEVTAWRASLPAGADALSPRMAMVLLLHSSWLRWLEYSALLEEQVREASGAAGLVGSTMASGRGGLYATGSEVLALTQLEADERDRVMRYAKQCHDAGLFGEEW
jgi:hypothetical protein